MNEAFMYFNEPCTSNSSKKKEHWTVREKVTGMKYVLEHKKNLFILFNLDSEDYPTYV